MTMIQEVIQPPKSESRSGRILWLVGLLVALIVVSYLVAFLVLTLRSNELAVIPWFDVSSIVGTLLISGGLPYGVNRATYKPPIIETNGTDVNAN